MPDDIKGRRFDVWRYEQRENSTKLAKVPYNPKTGARADTSDPSTFGTFDETLQAYETGNYDGIGVGIFGNLVAIDIDHCINNGRLSPMAENIVNIMRGTYSEISPSEEGIRILCCVPDGFVFDKNRYYINNQKLGLVYVAGATSKYVTTTGWVLVPDMSLAEQEQELLTVLENWMLRPQPQATAPAPATPSASADARLTAADYQLIQTVQQSPSGPAFMVLGCGDMSAYNNDHSAADMAFTNHIAAYTDDPMQIDRIVRASKLMRPKWDSPRGDSTYGWNTVRRAIAGAQSYREQLRTEQMEQAAAQTGTPAPDHAERVAADPVPILEADQAPTQALDLAAVQAAGCVPAEAAPQPQGMQVITGEQIQAHQKQQRQQELMAKYPSLSAQELYDANLPPILFLVEKLISEGLGIIVAASKFGKSFMALWLAICVAAGRPFLSHQTTQCGVLYLALEDNLQRLQSRMKQMLQGRRPPDGFYLMIQSPNMEGGMFELLDAQLTLHPEIRLKELAVVADSEEVDLLAAIREAKNVLSSSRAVDAHNKMIVIVDTGISTTGDLNFCDLDFLYNKPDINEIVQQLKDYEGTGVLPDLTGVDVTFIGTSDGLAEVASPQEAMTTAN